MILVTTSCDCRISEERSDQTAGAIVYAWDGDGRRFPEDVTHLYIRMPVTWRQATPEVTDLDPEYADTPVDVGWAVDHPSNGNSSRPKWKLSGTLEKPTLSPSLHWIGVWHGFLKDGRLESC